MKSGKLFKNLESIFLEYLYGFKNYPSTNSFHSSIRIFVFLKDLSIEFEFQSFIKKINLKVLEDRSECKENFLFVQLSSLFNRFLIHPMHAKTLREFFKGPKTPLHLNILTEVVINGGNNTLNEFQKNYQVDVNT